MSLKKAAQLFHFLLLLLYQSCRLYNFIFFLYLLLGVMVGAGFGQCYDLLVLSLGA